MSNTPQSPNRWSTLKQALIAVAIGSLINFCTLVLQALLNWFQEISPEIPGIIGGVGKYLYSWKNQNFS